MKIIKFKIMVLFIVSLAVPLSSQQWQPYNSGISDAEISCMFSNNEKIFVGTWKHGVFSSEIKINDWNAVNNGLDTNYPGIQSITISNNNVLTVTSTGLYISSNFGSNWKVINENYLTPGYKSTSSFISISNNVLYGEDGAIFLSDNYGSNWKLVASGGLYRGISSFATNEKYIFAGSFFGLLFSSIDGGNKWDSINHFPANINTLQTDGNVIMAGTSKGIYLSNDDGYSWKEVNNGLSNLSISSIVITGKYLFAGTSAGVYMAKKDSNIIWNQINNGLTHTSATCLSLNGNILFAGTFGGGVFKLDLSTLSVDDTTIGDFISLYPNPATDKLYLEGEPTALPVRIFTPEGIKVLECEFKREIDISNLAAGLYFVQIGKKVEKLVKF